MMDTSLIGILTGVAGSILGALISVLTAGVFKKINGYSKRVFISYSKRDKEFVTYLSKQLNDIGIKTVTDDEAINIGDNIINKVKEAIDKSDATVVIVSKAYLESTFSKLELNYAIERNKRILPVIIEDVILPREISEIKYLNAFDNNNDSLNQLVKSINNSQTQI